MGFAGRVTPARSLRVTPVHLFPDLVGADVSPYLVTSKLELDGFPTVDLTFF